MILFGEALYHNKPTCFKDMNHCYIIYSKTLDRYYIGATHSLLNDRIEKHNDHSYGDHRFTAKASDWTLILDIECDTYSQAIQIEKHVKKMKSKIYIL